MSWRAAAVAALITAAAPAALVGAATAPAREPRAPASPDAIVEYRESGEWDRDTADAIDSARAALDARLDGGARRPAIVLDIDDTSLSNYPCLKRSEFAPSARRGCSRGGRLPAIGQTRELFDHARAHGVAVFFITGRRASVRGVTERNLRRAGYRGWSKLVMRPDDQPRRRHDGWKARRRRALARSGYDVLVNVGDQRSDLAGGYAQRSFKLPNPMYVIETA